MSLLDALTEGISPGRDPVAHDADRCLHARDRASTCEACFAVCPAGAITPGSPPALSPGACQACLACLPVCPTGAYHAEDAARALVRAAPYLEGSTIEIVCARNLQSGQGVPGSGAAIRVRGCLAGLGAGMYLALAALGLERILVRTDACAACPWASLRPHIDTQLMHARRLLAAWGKSESIASVDVLQNPAERPVWNAGSPPVSRRDFFRMLVRQGQVAAADGMEAEPADPDRHPNRDRLRLLGALAQLPPPPAEPAVPLGDLGFATVAVSEACSACEACARACPTGALQFLKNEDSTLFALRFSARDCIGCDLCARVCGSAALRVDHAPSFHDVFAAPAVFVHRGALTRCKRCGASMAGRPGADVCTLCEYRRANPFGSTLPPGFKPAPPRSEETTP